MCVKIITCVDYGYAFLGNIQFFFKCNIIFYLLNNILIKKWRTK